MYRRRESEPISSTFTGYIATSKDALVVIHNALIGRFPLVKRRPKEQERPNLIRSGNIFVFIEESSGIKRWTDGMNWSPSRILGRFLIYRELDKDQSNNKTILNHNTSSLQDDSSINNLSKSIVSKGPNGFPQPATAVDLAGGENLLPTSVLNRKRKSTKSYQDDHAFNSSQGYPLTGCPQSGFSSPSTRYNNNLRNSEFDTTGLSSSTLVSCVLKEQGLIKKSLSIVLYDEPTIYSNKKTIHLVSYYTSADVLNDILDRPSNMDQYKDIQFSFEMLNALRKTSIGSTLTTARRNSEIEGHFQGFIEMDGFNSNFNEEFLKMLEERQKAHPELFATQGYSKGTILANTNHLSYGPSPGAPTLGSYMYSQQQQTVPWNGYDYSTTTSSNTNTYPQYQMVPMVNSSTVQLQQQQQQQQQQPYLGYNSTTASFQQQTPQYIMNTAPDYQQSALQTTNSTDLLKTSPTGGSGTAHYSRSATKSLPYNTATPSTTNTNTPVYNYGYQTQSLQQQQQQQQQQHYQGYLNSSLPYMGTTNSQQGVQQQHQQMYMYTSMSPLLNRQQVQQPHQR